MTTARMLVSSRRAPAGPCRLSAAQARESIRYRLALRLDRYETRYARALDLLADVIVALHDELHGCMSALAGTYPVRNWTAVLWGERDLSFKDVCRLATSPHPRAHAAALAVAQRLAAAVGYELVPVVNVVAEPHEAVALLSEATGDVVAEMSRDLSDGDGLNAQEAADLEPEVARLDAARAVVKATVAQAREARA